MNGVNPIRTSRRPRWYGSLYFRIGFSFVVFVVGVVVAQSAIFSYVLARSNPFPNRSPNNLAAIVAADVGSRLAENPDLDIAPYLANEYGRIRFPVFVVMKDGRAAANAAATLPQTLRRSVDAMLSGIDVRRRGPEALLEGGAPIVMAPIQVGGELRGMVVMPPPIGAQSPVVRDVGRLLSFPGNLLLIVATVLVAAIVFEPARRRLKALERATERLGAGDLAARASERGGDEIARVAGAFNRMASELAKRDEALRMSDRLRRQMLADISHELKTPLTTMRGYVETLRMEAVSTDPAARQRYLATIERETLRLDRIVKDLLDLARLEQGGVTLDVRLFAIRRVFDHVMARHEFDAEARRVSIDAVVTDDADQILGDPYRIEQVVENLVANALHHTPDRGRIELRAEAANGAIVISVADSGTGVPSEHVPYVFDRFYKVDEARTNGSGGSGLGLSIAKAIVERHGGTIGLVSQPGRTVFTVTLPQTPDGSAYSTSANL